MANVLNRTTKQYLRSVNEPEYPQEQWIWNPDVSAVEGFDTKYWLIDGDTVSLMSQAERESLDELELNKWRDEAVQALTHNDDILRAVALRIIDEFGRHAVRSNAILNAINAANTLDDVKTTLTGLEPLTIPPIPTLLAEVRAKVGKETE